jgi:hypothetical protein
LPRSRTDLGLPRQAPAEVGERETSPVVCGVFCDETWRPSASEIRD